MTTELVELIASGKAVEIEEPRPDAPGKWYMKQPTSIVFDDALMVQNAAFSRALSMPEIQEVSDLPPSNDWLAKRAENQKDLERELAILKQKKVEGSLGPDEATSLSVLEAQLEVVRMITMSNRAEELASRRSAKARDRYLLNRLIVGEDGELLYPPGAEGDQRLEDLGMGMIDTLYTYVHQVLAMVQIAKKSPPDARTS